MTETAARFAEHDLDCNQRLDFEEFYGMQPRKLQDAYGADEIRRWFDKADLDGDGTVSIDEFFLWSLGNAALHNGASSISAAFAKYDADKTGCLDAREFERACKDMGFGVVAHSIFASLDHDHSGTVSYKELADTFERDVEAVSPKTKQMMTTLMWSSDCDQEQKRGAIDTSGWVIRGSSAEQVRTELQKLLESSGGHVADLMRLFDQDTSNALLIDYVEFHNAMQRRLGFKGPLYVLKDVFNMLDGDGSGAVGFDELFEFVRGHRHSLDHRNKRLAKMRLQPPAGANYTLKDIAWDVNALRTLMQSMLADACVGTSSLMKVWDKSGDGELGMHEWTVEIGRYFADEPALWEKEVQPVVQQAFNEIDLATRHAGHSGLIRGSVDIVELERWLNHSPEGATIILKSEKKSRRVSRDTATKKNVLLVGKLEKKRHESALPAPEAAVSGGTRKYSMSAADKAVVASIDGTQKTSARQAVNDARSELVAYDAGRVLRAAATPWKRCEGLGQTRWEVPSQLHPLPPLPLSCDSSSKTRVKTPPGSLPMWYHFYAEARTRKAGDPARHGQFGWASSRRQHLANARNASGWLELGP